MKSTLLFFPKKKQKNILKQYFCNVLTGFGAPWWLIAAAHAEQKNEMTEYIFKTFFFTDSVPLFILYFWSAFSPTFPSPLSPIQFHSLSPSLQILCTSF